MTSMVRAGWVSLYILDTVMKRNTSDTCFGNERDRYQAAVTMKYVTNPTKRNPQILTRPRNINKQEL